ncbi:MAG: hypothetical protein P1P76_09250 [Anaerolineales bacterium]|nr:hypothetical protein [Anaerolineales bacterium]
MRTWSLPLSAPISLTLASDAGSAGFEPDNDQIWQLAVTEEDPTGVAVWTTYGRRAKGMRIVSAFELGEQIRNDPATFSSPPIVQTWLPDYIKLHWRPFSEFEVTAEYWVRSSALLAGRFTFINLTEEPIQPSLRLYGILEPGENPLPMSASVESGVQVLSGRTAGLSPLILLEGGARDEPAPYPALSVNTVIPVGGRHSWVWSHCGADSVSGSFKRCRELAGSNWDADLARLFMEHRDLIDVDSSSQEWDAAFWASQCEARRLFLRPNRRIKAPVPVHSRTIKDGSSIDGTATAWEPASPWDAFHAALQVLPTSADKVKAYLEALLRLQDADGHIPVLTGFGPPPTGWLYPPLLAQLAWKVYRATEDVDFLSSALLPLTAFYERWFGSDHDRDQDGFPEWDHVHQAGFKTWPAFSPWFNWSMGLDLSTAETLDLASLLVLEGEALISIAAVIDDDKAQKRVGERIGVLKRRVNQMWVEPHGYRHVDHYLDETVSGKRLGVRRGSFVLDVDKGFALPVRTLFKIEGPEEQAREMVIRIHGRGRRGPGRVERYDFRDLAWFLDLGYLTSAKPSAEIEKIEIEGLSRKFKTTLSIGDYSRPDLTQLLPLAAGIPSAERARSLVREIIMDPERYWRPNGIPSVPANDPDYRPKPDEGAGAIKMLWNHWIGSGLLRYGYHQEAGELLARLMKPVLEALKSEHEFTPHYDPDGEMVFRGNGGGAGLAPLALFLEILGVELITPRKVRIRPGHPFDDSICLRWQGLEIVCEPGRTIVSFPDGGVAEVEGESTRIIEQIE